MTTSASPSVGIGRIAQVAVVTRDLARAVAFYRDTLELPFLFEAPGLAFLRCGDVRLMLTAAATPEYDHPGSLLYLAVPDVVTAHAALARRGVAFKGPPRVIHRDARHELRMAFFDDPDGNPLAIMAEVPVAAPADAAGAVAR